MRKIWIVIPFTRTALTRSLHDYVSSINENCRDVSSAKMFQFSNTYDCGLSIEKDGSFDFFTKQRIVCTVKQIEIDMQDFPDVPNATIKEQNY